MNDPTPLSPVKAANQLKAMAGAAIATVTLVGMLVGGIIWIYTVKADTDRALIAIGKLEARLDAQTESTRKLHDAVLKLTYAVDSLAKIYESRK